MNLRRVSKTRKTASDDEMELESVTKRYIMGEIDLDEYKKASSRVETRLDLRRVVSKLKPILAPIHSDSPN